MVAIILFSCRTIAADASVARTFEDGEHALEKQQYSSAEQSFLKVLRVEPGNVSALSNLGIVYSRTHRYGLAIDSNRKALALDPQNERILVNFGLAYLKNQDCRRALPQFLAAEGIDPSNQQIQELTATCQALVGDPAEGNKRLESLRQSEPGNPAVIYLLGVAYIRSAQPDRAKRTFGELLTSANSEQADFLLGKALYDSGQFAEAEKMLTRVVANLAKVDGAQLALAKVYISEREDAKAEAQLQAILKEQPSDADAHYYLGALLVNSGHYEAALPHLELAKRYLPDSWAVYYYLGKASLKLIATGEAASFLKRSIELNPDEPSTYYLLGRALQAADKPLEATAAFTHSRLLRSKALGKEETVLADIPSVK